MHTLFFCPTKLQICVQTNSFACILFQSNRLHSKLYPSTHIQLKTHTHTQMFVCCFQTLKHRWRIKHEDAQPCSYHGRPARHHILRQSGSSQVTSLALKNSSPGCNHKNHTMLQVWWQKCKITYLTVKVLKVSAILWGNEKENSQLENRGIHDLKGN